MAYRVRIDNVAQDISDGVRNTILEFLPSFDFPYITTVTNKEALRKIFIEHFQKRHSLDWLIQQIYLLNNNVGGAAIAARSETNRLHTKALGTILLSRGETQCKTIHTYGYTTPMSDVCRENLEGKILDIKEIIANSFPRNIDGLNRTDIPMIPQHATCRHIMAPRE